MLEKSVSNISEVDEQDAYEEAKSAEIDCMFSYLLFISFFSCLCFCQSPKWSGGPEVGRNVRIFERIC